MKIIHSALLSGAAVLLYPSAAMAQEAAAAQPAVEQQAVPAVVETVAPAVTEAALPANTEVVLTANETVSSKTHRLGDKFSLTVAQDVKVDGRVVVARGTRAVAQVVKRSGRGGFGKSGKMDVAFRYLDLDGKKIPLEGQHHQEGEGKTAATVGAVMAAGVIGGLMVKGKSAKIEGGREFTVRTAEALPVTFSGDGPAVIAASYTPSAVNLDVAGAKAKKREQKVKAATRKK